jgi:CubicO group peptidase (beta-lactamase class C family)
MSDALALRSGHGLVVTAMNASVLLEAAGLPTTSPIVFAARGLSGRFSNAAGRWASDRPVSLTDLFYTASLTKQVTGATVAMLAKSGEIELDTPIAKSFLPTWPCRPTVRQLLHHVGSLPGAGVLEDALHGRAWTKEFVLESAERLDPPGQAVGSTYVYSNIGYVILAAVLESATGQSFPELAARVLPAQSEAQMTFPASKIFLVSPQASRLGSSQPLTVGDGGLWSTAEAYADFLDMQNDNALGISDLTQADFVLPSGEPTRYGWGVGIRTFRDYPLFIHGGSWEGACCKAVRSPTLKMSIVVLTASDQPKAVGKLVDMLSSAVML